MSDPVRKRLNPWLRLVLIWTLLGVGTVVLLRVPFPGLEELPGLQNLLVVAGAIVLAGKALYDTLFYDRFPV